MPNSTEQAIAMAEGRRLLLSLLPRHAGAIVDGYKTVELRRRRVAAPEGTKVILYASSPVKAVVGTARLRASRICSAEAAWAEFSANMALDRDEFDAYLGGTDACLLMLDHVRRVDPPLSLEELRKDQPFQPPQSYRYVSRVDPIQLQSLPSQSRTLRPRIP
jgi:predicted transcriptional regulator